MKRKQQEEDGCAKKKRKLMVATQKEEFHSTFGEAGMGTYDELMEKFGEDWNTSKPLNFADGEGGMGMGFLVRGFGGDGTCKVFGKKNEQGDLVELRICLPKFAQVKTTKGMEEWFLGTVGVDSGQLLITDPCYVLHTES